MQNFCQLTVLWVAISAQAFRCSIFMIKIRLKEKDNYINKAAQNIKHVLGQDCMWVFYL